MQLTVRREAGVLLVRAEEARLDAATDDIYVDIVRG